MSGFALLAFAAAVRVFGGAIYFAWLDQIALLPFLAGLVLVFGGWPVLRWAAAPLLFLAYLVPVRYRFVVLLGFPLHDVVVVPSFGARGWIEDGGDFQMQLKARRP